MSSWGVGGVDPRSLIRWFCFFFWFSSPKMLGWRFFPTHFFLNFISKKWKFWWFSDSKRDCFATSNLWWLVTWGSQDMEIYEALGWLCLPRWTHLAAVKFGDVISFYVCLSHVQGLGKIPIRLRKRGILWLWLKPHPVSQFPLSQVTHVLILCYPVMF